MYCWIQLASVLFVGEKFIVILVWVHDYAEYISVKSFSLWLWHQFNQESSLKGINCNPGIYPPNGPSQEKEVILLFLFL